MACANRPPVTPRVDPDPRLGPPHEMVRADLDCPTGKIVWVGGAGTGDRVILRTLEACGKPASNLSTETGWVLQREDR